MPAPTPPAAPAPLGDAEIERLHTLLQALPAPLEPLDLPSLDGYLCGVLLQPQPPALAAWWPRVLDHEGRALPAGTDASELQALVQRRHDELKRAIAQRDWFDPWVFPAEDDDAPPTESVLPWVAGFAEALDLFPQLLRIEDPELIEPLALLYLHFDPADLEDADALLAVIETLEPPSDLAEAVQDLVRSVMLIADVSQPRAPTPAQRRAGTRKPATRPAGRPNRPRR